MAGIQARSYSWVLFLSVFLSGPLAVRGQSELPPIVPANPASDQLPSRRSFAPLPINDLRSPGGNLNPAGNSSQGGNESASDPGQATQLGQASPGGPAESAKSAAADSPQDGTTSGVFLRPQAAPQVPSQLTPAFGAPSALAPAGLPEPAYSPPLNPALDSAPRQSSGAYSSSPSRPVELIPEQPNLEQPILDSQIRLASGSEAGIGIPSRSPRGPAAGTADLARQLLDRYDVGHAPDPLPGRPIRLEDALQAAPPERRRAIVRQYWQTYAAWAQFLNRCDRCTGLTGITANSDPQQAQLLETSRQLAEGERLQAEIRLQLAQLELGRLLPSAGSELLPLPADQPVVQPYETHYDWYIANGALPPQVQAIARTLPKQLKLLQHRAATAEQAMSGATRIVGQLGSSGSDLSTRLATLELAEQAQQAFLQSVLDYNLWIADYSLTIVPAGQDPTAVAGMLVAPRRAGLERPASALAQTAPGAGSLRQTERQRLAAEPLSVVEPAGFQPQRQPIERVSGLEPAGEFGRNAPPAVAPAFGGGAAEFSSRPEMNPASRPPAGLPPAVAPPTPVEQLPTPSGGGTGAANSGSVGGSFTPPGSFAPPPGSFAPPPNIPSFDAPKPQAAGDKPPAPAATGGSGAGFQFGG